MTTLLTLDRRILLPALLIALLLLPACGLFTGTTRLPEPTIDIPEPPEEPKTKIMTDMEMHMSLPFGDGLGPVISPDESKTAKVSVQNTGPGTAEGTRIMLDMNNGTFTDTPGNDAVECEQTADDQVGCSVDPALPAGSIVEMLIDFEAENPGTLTLSGKVNSDSQDPNESNNRVQQTVTVTTEDHTAEHHAFGDTRMPNFARGDAAPRVGGFAEGGVDYYSFDADNVAHGFVQGEYAVTDRVAVGAELGYQSLMPSDDQLEGVTGFADPEFSIWVSPFRTPQTNTAVGGRFTAPVGNEDVGQGFFDYGVFGAARHTVGGRFLLAGQLGVDFNEPFFEQEDRQARLSAHAGLVYDLTESINVFVGGRVQQEAEFADRQDQFNYAKGGVSYQFAHCFDIRGAAGTGVGDNAPGAFGEIKLGGRF